MSEITRNTQSDFDSIHGTSISDPSKPLVLYWNKKRAVDGLKKRTLRLSVIYFTAYAYMAISSSFFLSLVEPDLFNEISRYNLALIICILGVLLACSFLISFLKAVRYIHRAIEPVIVLNAEGISVNVPGRSYSVIPWQYVKAVTTVNNFSWMCVRILVDIDAIYHKNTNARRNPLQSHIDISVDFLPIDAQEFIECAKIRHTFITKSESENLSIENNLES